MFLLILQYQACPRFNIILFVVCILCAYLVDVYYYINAILIKIISYIFYYTLNVNDILFNFPEVIALDHITPWSETVIISFDIFFIFYKQFDFMFSKNHICFSFSIVCFYSFFLWSYILFMPALIYL